jgi:hypothetical protein
MQGVKHWASGSIASNLVGAKIAAAVGLLRIGAVDDGNTWLASKSGNFAGRNFFRRVGVNALVATPCSFVGDGSRLP